LLVALDTNVLVYAEGINGQPKQHAAQAIVGKLAPESTLLPLQVLEELFNVLVVKGRQSRAVARDAVQRWGDTFPLIETSSSAMLLAMDLAADHQLGLWDAVVLSAAADARCRLLLSEDLQDGFTWSGVTVTNPFASTRHPLLEAMLTARRGGRNSI
jgi:predicted nucleic acid-binding protein